MGYYETFQKFWAIIQLVTEPTWSKSYAYAQFELYMDGCRDIRMHDQTLVLMSEITRG